MPEPGTLWVWTVACEPRGCPQPGRCGGRRPRQQVMEGDAVPQKCGSLALETGLNE